MEQVHAVEDVEPAQPINDVVIDPVVTTRIASGAPEDASPGDQLRSLIEEATLRGSPVVSALAMQWRLFRIYDAVSVVPDALALVQRQLGLTLDRNWYSTADIVALADEIDRCMSLVPDAVADVEAVLAERAGGRVGAGETD